MKKRFLAFLLLLLMLPCAFSFVACSGSPSGGNGSGSDSNGNENDPNWPTYSNITYKVSNIRGGVLLEDIIFSREGDFPTEFHVPKYVNGKKVLRIACWAFRDVYQDPYMGHNWDSFNDPVHNFPYNKIIVPDTVEVIDSGAFSLCTAKEIEFQGANTQFVNLAGGYVNSLFAGCWLLEKVRLPENLTTIHQEMFQNCKSLVDVVIPEKVTYIDWLAFDNCESLETITIPASVEEIAREAFPNLRNLKTVYFEGDTIYYTDYDPETTRGASFKRHSLWEEIEFIRL